MQVSILIKCAANIIHVGRANTDLFIRLKALESHKLLKLEMPVAMFTQDPQWQKLWVLQCEARTKGVVLELRYQVEGCLRSLQKSKRVGGARLTWNDLQKTPMLFHEILFSLPEKRFSLDSHRHPHQLRLGISLTPAVQVRIICWLCHVIRCVSNAIEFSVLGTMHPGTIHFKKPRALWFRFRRQFTLQKGLCLRLTTKVNHNYSFSHLHFSVHILVVVVDGAARYLFHKLILV